MPHRWTLIVFVAVLVASPWSALAPSQGGRAEASPAPEAPMVRALEAEIERLREERDRWEIEATRCQAKLERAERRAGALSVAQLTAIGDPEVRRNGEDVLVSVELLNAGFDLAQGTAVIELWLDGKLVASAKEAVSVAADAGATVSHRFPGLAGKGKLSATVHFAP